jgi:arginyl-tRNA synthetase
MKKVIENLLEGVMQELKISPEEMGEVTFVVERPEIMAHGDYATNVALVLAQKTGKNPRHLAEEIVAILEKQKPAEVVSLSIAGPGFINFHLSEEFFLKNIETILTEKEHYGKNQNLKQEKTIVEYTDPNPFKEFHIGHVMSNAIGEAISRLIEWNGAEVKRACYQGDKGLHVARAIAYKLKTDVSWDTVKDVAHSYTEGSKLIESDEDFKQFVVEINKKIYSEEDGQVLEIYNLGRTLTLDYFETLYKVLGTTFDFHFFESTTGEFGKALVRKNIPEVFEESEGAIVFRGENRDAKLHTRVFINKEGLPTYEAKELGLAKIKYDTYPYEKSIVITGNEVNDYFKVLMTALKELFPALEAKTRHIGHGMLRLPSGKMSSRTGDVITAEALIEAVSEKVREKMNDSEHNLSEDDALISDIAVAAIKYSILKQAPGRDIVFDLESATSFEGDSGPYIQYTAARIHSLLEKGKVSGMNPKLDFSVVVGELEKTLSQFPEVVARAHDDYAPQYLTTFLIRLSSVFNSYYSNHLFLDEKEPTVSAHRLALAQAVRIVLQNGLSILGIVAPDRM